MWRPAGGGAHTNSVGHEPAGSGFPTSPNRVGLCLMSRGWSESSAVRRTVRDSRTERVNRRDIFGCTGNETCQDDSGSIPELRCWVRSKSEQLAPRWSHSIVCDTHLHIWRLCRRLDMSIGRGAAPTVCQTPTIPRAVCPPIGRTHRRSTGWSPTCRRGVGPAAIFSSGTQIDHDRRPTRPPRRPRDQFPLSARRLVPHQATFALFTISRSR